MVLDELHLKCAILAHKDGFVCVVPGHSQHNWQQVQLSLPRFPNCPLAHAVLSAAACLCLRKSEGENEAKASSYRGQEDENKQLYWEKRDEDDGFGRWQKHHFCHLVLEGGSKSCRQIWTKFCCLTYSEDNVWGLEDEKSEYDCGPLLCHIICWFLFSFVLIFCPKNILRGITWNNGQRWSFLIQSILIQCMNFGCTPTCKHDIKPKADHMPFLCLHWNESWGASSVLCFNQHSLWVTLLLITRSSVLNYSNTFVITLFSLYSINWFPVAWTCLFGKLLTFPSQKWCRCWKIHNISLLSLVDLEVWH